MTQPEQDGPADREFRPVKSADRTLDVLEAVAAGPASLSDLARQLGIPKSSLHGLVRTLTNRGWVAPVDGGSRLRLGLRALQVGSRFVDEDEVVAHVGPSLDRLAAVTGETVQQARLDGDQVVYLAKRDTSHPVRIISSIGTRLPAHATALGKALLAADPGAGARLAGPLVALTPHTLTEPAAVEADLELTRRGATRSTTARRPRGCAASRWWCPPVAASARRPTRSASRCRPSGSTTSASPGWSRRCSTSSGGSAAPDP